MPATQLTNRRNQNGVKASCDLYRHFNGELFVAWLIYPTAERIAAYRAAGVRCRRLKQDLFIHDDDRNLARDIDAAHNFN
jgi:hypothetical protein